MKKESGITLIALVVTIIVLMILSGVAISLIAGNKSIMQGAQDASNKYSVGASNEKNAVDKLTNVLSENQAIMGDKTAPTVGVIETSNIDITSFTLTATGEDELGISKYEFYIDGKLYNTVTTSESTAICNVTEKANGTSYKCKVKVYDKAGNSKDSEEITVKTATLVTITDILSDINANSNAGDYYGKYVTNYLPTYTNPETEDVKWRIFYVGPTPGGTENNIYLIADHYMPRTELPAGYGNVNAKLLDGDDEYGLRTAYFSNEDDFEGTVMEVYSGGSESIVNDNSVRNWLSLYWEALGTNSNANANMKAVAYMMDTRVWNKFGINGISKYVIGGPTIELFAKSWNTVNSDIEELELTANATGYYINGDYSISGLTDTINLWIPAAQYNTDGNEYKERESQRMWIASPSYYSITTIIYIHSEYSISCQFYGRNMHGFRPIVCLNTDVQLSTTDDGATYKIVGIE